MEKSGNYKSENVKSGDIKSGDIKVNNNVGVDCSDIVEFIKSLNESVRDKKVTEFQPLLDNINKSCEIKNLDVVLRIYLILEKIEKYFQFHDPKNFTNCRFGNKAFSTLIYQLQTELDEIFVEYGIVIEEENLYNKAKKHFLNSFGNSTRLDFGTGNELEFVYFLRVLYLSNLFNSTHFQSIVLLLLNKYFEVCREMIERYTLEPAGTKGAWGIDDYQFLPFIFGSSQLINSNLLPKHCLEMEFLVKFKDDYLFMRAMEYKINMIKGVSLEIGAPMICNILTSCTWEKINYGLFQLYINDIQRLNEKKIINQ